jgi:hypothetical protein
VIEKRIHGNGGVLAEPPYDGEKGPHRTSTELAEENGFVRDIVDGGRRKSLNALDECFFLVELPASILSLAKFEHRPITLQRKWQYPLSGQVMTRAPSQRTVVENNAGSDPVPELLTRPRGSFACSEREELIE